MAQNLNLKINKGSKFRIRMTFKDSLGALQDVSGQTFNGQIRDRYDSSVILASFTFTHISLGIVDATMTPVVTRTLPEHPSIDNKRRIYKAIYDIERYTIADVDDDRIVEGEVDISPEATK